MELRKCHNCKSKGVVDGGAKKNKHECRRVGKCFYCKGSGYKKVFEDGC